MIITILRKSLEGSVLSNTLKHGCGVINIEETRVEGEPWKWGTQTDLKGGGFGSKRPSEGNILRKNVEGGFNGRWPANVILIGGNSAQELDRQSGIKTNTSHYSYKRSNGDFIDKIPDMVEKSHWRTETGGASRFFKQFKKEEPNEP